MEANLEERKEKHIKKDHNDIPHMGAARNISRINHWLQWRKKSNKGTGLLNKVIQLIDK